MLEAMAGRPGLARERVRAPGFLRVTEMNRGVNKTRKNRFV
jgi:hypothetical protein